MKKIKENIQNLKETGINDISKRSESLAELERYRNVINTKYNNELDSMTPEEIEQCTELIDFIEDSIEEINKVNEKKVSWFRRHPKITVLGLSVALLASIASCAGYKKGLAWGSNNSDEFEENLEELKNKSSDETIAKMNAVALEEKERREEKQLTKEEEIVELVKEATKKLNEFEGLNVTFEQTLALFIHINVGNSYANEENTLALDKLTREDLIKRYYVGLTPKTEEFEEYKITDDDLSKLTSSVMELRNELNNYIIILNDQGKYEESRKILEILNSFITEKELKDEAKTLIDSVKSIQTKDNKEIKKHAYLWYNYIYAGPKSNVRNFDEFGYYYDADKKVMTFENQGMTIRFLTWFLSVFVDINANNGKNIIPQDIVNDAQAKLLDQSNLLRALGYKNCNAFGSIYDMLDFDKSISNKTTKTTKKSNISSTSKPTKATGDEKKDAEIDAFLKENATIGSSTITSDGSTVTITESGPTTTTIEVAPNPNSATTEVTTPAGPSETTVIEGGGNETVEEIIFEEDKTNEVIIEQGGEEISNSTETYSVNPSAETYSEPIQTYSEPTETYNEPVQTYSEPVIEEIIFEEDKTNEVIIEQGGEPIVEEMTFEEDNQTASLRDEINEWLEFRNMFTEYFNGYTVTIEDEKPFEKTYTC